MERIVALLTGKSRLRDDDFVDRLINYRLPTIFMAIFSFSVFTQFVGFGVNCWMPPEFFGPMEEAGELMCTTNLTHPNGKADSVIVFYMWVPWLLFGASGLLAIWPNLIKTGATIGGFSFASVYALASQFDPFNRVLREVEYRVVGQQFWGYGRFCRQLSRTGFWNRIVGQHRFTYYMLNRKLFNISLISCMIVFMGLSGMKYDLILSCTDPAKILELRFFPSVVSCNVTLRDLTVYSYTFQCVLRAARLYDSIIIISWTILCFSWMFAVLNLLNWLVFILFCQDRYFRSLLSRSGINVLPNGMRRLGQNCSMTDIVVALCLLELNDCLVGPAEIARHIWIQHTAHQ